MSITSSSAGDLLSFGVVFAVVFGGVTLWRRRVHGLAMGVSMRAALHLTRYAVALEYYGLRQTEITSHLEALRGDLGAVDASEVDATLRRLGPPAHVACRGDQRDTATLVPSWRGLVRHRSAVRPRHEILATEAFLGGFEAVAEPGSAFVESH